MTTPDTDSVRAAVPTQREAPAVPTVPVQRRGTPASAPAHGGARLGFLDVLRGLAAISVVAYHLGNQGPSGSPGYWWFSHSVLNLGAFGVLLFFIVSGFIIPASLERTGSIEEFWISRGFRLFPLFWLVSGAVLVLYYAGLLYLPGYMFKYKLMLILGNGTLLSHFLGSSVLIGPGWTLPFELCFYLLTTVLFVTRLRRKSAAIALTGAVLALVAFDRIFPMWAFTPRALGVKGHEGASWRVVGMALVVGIVAALLTRSRAAAIYAGLVGGGVTLLLLNRPWPLHEAAIYITLMFTGTVIYRISAGQLSRRTGWSVVAIVSAACTAAYFIHTDPLVTAIGEERGSPGETWWTRSVALLAAVAVFTLFFAVRDKVRWPDWLQWLGRISYSVYLIHWVVMNTVPGLPAGVPARGLLSLVMWLAITLVLSTLTYRFVEEPSIALGRRLARRLRAYRATHPAPLS